VHCLAGYQRACDGPAGTFGTAIGGVSLCSVYACLHPADATERHRSEQVTGLGPQPRWPSLAAAIKTWPYNLCNEKLSVAWRSLWSPALRVCCGPPPRGRSLIFHICVPQRIDFRSRPRAMPTLGGLAVPPGRVPPPERHGSEPGHHFCDAHKRARHQRARDNLHSIKYHLVVVQVGWCLALGVTGVVRTASNLTLRFAKLRDDP
jgi:hypothetical protein